LRVRKALPSMGGGKAARKALAAKAAQAIGRQNEEGVGL